MARTVWIGLATVQQQEGVDILGQGHLRGVVNILALAADAPQFEGQVKIAASDLGLTLIELEDCEPLEDRLAAYTVDEHLLEKAREVRETGEMRFGTFHTYEDGGSS